MAAREDDNFEHKGSMKWQCGDPYQYPITGEGDHWEKLIEPLLEKDRVQCESWRDEVQNLLIFAGLFSAVLSAFVVVSYPTLQPDQNEIMISLLAHIATRLDNPLSTNSSSISQPINMSSLSNPPASSSIRINVLWFISLVLSLTTALVGIVSLQWLREHQQYPSSLPPRQKFAMFNMRAEALDAWYVPQIFSSLPLLLQLALAFFFMGLIDFLLVASLRVAIPVIVFIGIPFLFLILTTTIPALQMFVFCLPLPDRIRRVPQQAPYKSTQSRLFRRLITLSSHVFRIFTYANYAIYRFCLLWPALLQRFTKPRRNTLDTDVGSKNPHELRAIVDDVFEILESSSWLSFDKEWVIMRDAYAKSIFDKEWCMKALNRFRSKESAPFYDLTRGISNTIFEYAKSDPTFLCSGYLSIQEMTSTIIGEKASTSFRFSSKRESYNGYFQTLLTFSDLGKSPPTFCSLLEHPTVEFMQDENKFIFLSQYTQPPPFVLQHFAELHIRIANYLYPRDVCRTVRNPLADYPTYPEFQFYICYGKAPWQEAKYGSCFEGVSEQFSYFVNAYLEAITNPNLDDDALLTSLYSHKIGEFVEYAAFRQSSENIPSTLDLLSIALKNGIAGRLNKRSDLLFYISSFYAHFLMRSDSEFTYLQKCDDVPAVVAFLPVLRQYLDTRGTPDTHLRERLGIPNTSDGWWDFLNRGEDKPSAQHDSKGLSSGGSNVDISQKPEPLSSTVIADVPTDELAENDLSKLNPHAENLV